MKQTFEGYSASITVIESNRKDFFSGFYFESIHTDRLVYLPVSYPFSADLYQQISDAKKGDIDSIVELYI